MDKHPLKIHFGHFGSKCSLPKPATKLTVLHVNGFHHVWCYFCGCSRDAVEREEYNQLLDAHLFPATTDMPRTAFTFHLLDLLSTSTSRTKMSTYDLYNVLRCLTDNCELDSWPVSLNQFDSISN